MAKDRDISIDILRAIALLGIILIHVYPPHVALCQLRNFDVPLMIFLSGVGLIYSRRNFEDIKSVLQYYWRRIEQILIPTWLFLLIYWGLMYILVSYIPSLNEIFSYATLCTGWYVWIMRVFLITALFAPLLQFVKKNVSPKIIVPGVALILCLFELYAPEESDNFWFYLTMTIPYILIFAFGYFIDTISPKKQITILILAAIIYVIFAVRFFYETGVYQNTQLCKYPPRLYYTSYAVMCILLLWLVKSWIVRLLEVARLDKVFSFIGSHTMWIYFWHIIWLNIFAICDIGKLANAGGGLPNWIFAYVVVLAGATLATYIQNITISFLLCKCHNKSVNRIVETIFLR